VILRPHLRRTTHWLALIITVAGVLQSSPVRAQACAGLPAVRPLAPILGASYSAAPNRGGSTFGSALLGTRLAGPVWGAGEYTTSLGSTAGDVRAVSATIGVEKTVSRVHLCLTGSLDRADQEPGASNADALTGNGTGIGAAVASPLPGALHGINLFATVQRTVMRYTASNSGWTSRAAGTVLQGGLHVQPLRWFGLRASIQHARVDDAPAETRAVFGVLVSGGR
jgi:hypothetical protein